MEERGKQLAEVMGVTIGAVSKWESGLSNPDIMLLPKFARLFGILLDVLFSFQLLDHLADDLAVEIKTFHFEKQYGKGAEVALNAIRRHPNHFDVIYQSATLFMMQGVERGESGIDGKSLGTLPTQLSSGWAESGRTCW